MQPFPTLNPAYNTVFRHTRLSVGLVVPIEAYPDTLIPPLADGLVRVKLAEQLGFKAVWLRDVPLIVPSFGDGGQVHDPFVLLGLLAGQTRHIALGVASMILPLRHPAHVAKAASSVDVLSGGRLLLGVASGDRPEEYPALNQNYADRGERFRDSVEFIRQAAQPWPQVSNSWGQMSGQFDLLPKPQAGQLPLLVTGGAQQSLDWIAQQADGWMTYPRDIATQARVVGDWQDRLQRIERGPRPVMQPLYVDLTEEPDTKAIPIHLGFRLGVNELKRYLHELEQVGINHVAINLRFCQMDIDRALHQIADKLLPDFH